MSDNMELWEQVNETDPGTTKEVNFGRKFTAIDAYAQIKRATELWGPYGSTWGLQEIEHIFLHEPMALVKSRFKYPDGEFPVTSSIALTNKKGIDDDFAKKVETDLITKALSRLGFNADVFMGKFDDNRYVQEMSKKFSQMNPEPIDGEKVKKAIKFFKDKIDEDIEDAEKYGVIQAAWEKLTNDERLEVNSNLKEKAPGTNRMYSAILTGYREYKAEMLL